MFCVARARPGLVLFYIHATEKKRDVPFQMGSKKEPIDKTLVATFLPLIIIAAELYDHPITSYYPPLKIIFNECSTYGKD